MNALCFECDSPAEHHHHVVPRSVGGKRTVPLCASCHGKAHEANMPRSALTRAAMAKLRADGFLVGSVPHGYAVQAGRIRKCESEREYIDLIVGWRAEGLSYRDIAAQLYVRGFLNREGRQMNPKSVRAIWLREQISGAVA